MGTEPEKKEKPKFFKTVIQVTILSEDEPIGADLDLHQICDEITYGDCSGISKVISTEKLCGKRAAKLLIEQGSDPEFFNLDKNGNKLED
jgi:hypothetical protein